MRLEYFWILAKDFWIIDSGDWMQIDFTKESVCNLFILSTKKESISKILSLIKSSIDKKNYFVTVTV